LTSGDRQKALFDAAIDVTDQPDTDIYDAMLQSGVLERICHQNRIKLVFTAKGIYQVEKYENSFDENKLLEFIQSKFFNLAESNKKLKPKEKAVLLSLLTMHCFGHEKAMDLGSLNKQEVWYELIKDSSFSFLKQEHIVPLGERLLPETTGNETPASYLMRRQNTLSIKTAGLFQNPGNNKYFLDLSLTNQVETQNLIHFLIKLILPDQVSFETLERIKGFIRNTYHNYVPLTHGRVSPEDEVWSTIIDNSIYSVLFE